MIDPERLEPVVGAVKLLRLAFEAPAAHRRRDVRSYTEIEYVLRGGLELRLYPVP